MTLRLTLWPLKPQQTLTRTCGIPWPTLRVRVLMGWGQGQPGNTPGLPVPINNPVVRTSLNQSNLGWTPNWTWGLVQENFWTSNWTWSSVLDGSGSNWSSELNFSTTNQYLSSCRRKNSSTACNDESVITAPYMTMTSLLPPLKGPMTLYHVWYN